SLNLIKFYDEKSQKFLNEHFVHACELWTMVLEISVLMAQFPSEEIALRSYQYRTLGLGYANLGALLMIMGLPYDSDQGREVAASITALMGGASYKMSAMMAKEHGPFERYEYNKDDMLRVIRNHYYAVMGEDANKFEGLTITPQVLKKCSVDKEILDSAKKQWEQVLSLGGKYGFRNAQTTVI